MVTAGEMEEEEVVVMEQASFLRTRNLVQIGVYSISYMGGLFPEKYFNDKSVPALGMTIKKLMPRSNESRSLIEWTEKDVYDALQKKLLKTLFFCICDEEEGLMVEEYAFSFSYPNNANGSIAIRLTCKGSMRKSANAAEVTTDNMRSSACKMIRKLVSHINTLDHMPAEQTILVKLQYNNDITPEDFEPPLFKCCASNETINSKHMVLALKVNSVLYPSDDNNVNKDDRIMRFDNEHDQDDVFSDIEVLPSEVDCYVVASNVLQIKLSYILKILREVRMILR